MKLDETPSSGDSKYLKLNAGDKHVGVFVGDPVVFYVKWTDKKPVEVQKGEPGGKFRFRIAFILKDSLTPKVLESGAMVYNALKDLQGAGYDIENTWVKLSREGSGLNDTTYTVLPIPNGTISPADKAKINALPEISGTAAPEVEPGWDES